MLIGLHNMLFSFALGFFKNINRKIRSKLPSWRLIEETSEHVHMTTQVFEVIVLPFSMVYLAGNLLLLKENAFDSTLLGILVFFYSSFLPDLTSIYRRNKEKTATEDLPAYKKYIILLFAPLLILLLFADIHLGWKTTEDFHNFKSLTVYGGFLFLCGFVVFGGLPVSLGQIAEILVLPFYGTIGYLAHLRVDGQMAWMTVIKQND